MALRPVTVTQLNDYIGRVLQTDPLLGNISVIGEISNLKYHSTGHVYFSMVDEGSKVNCFLPSSYATKLPWQLKDGMEITVRGYINVFKKGGTYTLFVRTIEVSGEGNLATAFQAMKEKLEREGLFDAAHKKPIPTFPKKIGVVTSETGAAVQDILKIIEGRTSMVHVVVFPVLVQGQGAAEDISGMIDYINENYSDIDTLIVGRGGGSMEDLWAFNEEVLARAIYRSRIPIISAVGHEIDFTIADFVADLRAETPTAAAKVAVPDSLELKKTVDSLKDQLKVNFENKVYIGRLRAEKYREELNILLRNQLNDQKHRLQLLKAMLEENNPKNIMEKGYAVLEDQCGHVVDTTDGLQDGETYRIRLKDGSAVFKISDLVKEGDIL